MARKSNTEAVKIKEYIQKVKQAGKCVDCNESDAVVLDFDHLPEFEKKFNISQAVGLGCTLKNIMDEIAQCELVCSNCHRRRTALRHKTGEAKEVRSAKLSKELVPNHWQPFRDWCLRRRALQRRL